MNIKSKIKSLIKEADLYRSQGLLSESKGIYENALKIIQTRLSPQEGEKISKAISIKISSLEKEIIRVEKKVLSPEMSKESQDLITQMFSAENGKDQDEALLDAAKALIKFGQFERAIQELRKLLRIDALRADAARHILNCFFLENKIDPALDEYKKWCSDNNFSGEQLNNLENFIQSTFKTKGIDKEIPKRDMVEKEITKPILFDEDDEEFEEFDIMASIKKSKKTTKE